MAVFLPIYRCTGVDTSGMIVPLGGSNQVVLDTGGMAYQIEHPGIQLEEFDGRGIGRQLIELNNSLYDPSIDPNYRAAHLPIALYLEQPRYFRIFGKTIFSNVIKAVPAQHLSRKRMNRFTASLQVECVQQKTIKVAILNVKARDDNGAITTHATTPCDPDTEIKKMNAVWIPPDIRNRNADEGVRIELGDTVRPRDEGATLQWRAIRRLAVAFSTIGRAAPHFLPCSELDYLRASSRH